MKFYLKRTDFLDHGIYGLLLNENRETICHTLEHAYQDKDRYKSKIPNGTYTCVRGQHKLSHGPEFTTFEITGVKGHTNILFHKGNYNEDSEGCVLLGIGVNLTNKMITNSTPAFSLFLRLLNDTNNFTLIAE